VNVPGFMDRTVARFNLLRSSHAGDARKLLAQAGLRSQEAMVRYLFARIMLPFGFAIAVLIDSYGPRLLTFMVPAKMTTIAAMFAAIAGFYAPGMFLRNRSTKRGLRLQLGLPDALDLMVICAEAGLSLDAALVRVSRELEPTWPDLSEEFGITAAELTFLPDRRQALENLNQRTNLSSIRGVVNTLLQTARFGTPLAQSLRVLAAEFREARLTRAEEKAARLPAMLTVPMIVFILPTLFIVVLGPAILGVMDTFAGRKSDITDKTVTSNGSGQGGAPGTVTTVGEETPQSADGAGGNTTIVMRNEPSGKASVKDVTIVPTKDALRIIDPIVVDIDARALSSGFQHRLAVVPADTPDEVKNATEFGRDSVPVQPSRMRIFLSARSAGQNELRLYYVPQFGSELVVAARAKVTVKPGAPGATEAAELIRDAGMLGAAGFENGYRGRNLAIEGQFLRVEQHSVDELGSAAKLLRSLDSSKSYAAVFIGWPDTVPRIDGAPSELACIVPADEPTLQAKARELKPGEPILVRGSPAGFGLLSETSTAVVVSNCQLVP
jgi:tight adherence protein C